MENFMTKMGERILTKQGLTRTENGALGYSTTGQSLLDLNFSVSSMRSHG